MSKRILALLLSLVLISGVFFACNASETVTPTNTPTEASIVPSGYISLAEGGEARYSVVYESKLSVKTIDRITGIVSRLRYSIETELPCSSDASAQGAKEILIGNTNRAESGKYSENLRSGEYIIRYEKESDRIVIVGADDDALMGAVSYFFDTYVNSESKYLAVPNDLSVESLSDFLFKSISIDGVNIRNYKVVYPDECDKYTEYAALNLVDYIRANAGITLDMVSDRSDTTPYELLVGNTNRPESDTTVPLDDGGFLLVQKGTKVVMKGEGLYVGAGVGALLNTYFRGSCTDKVTNVTNLPSVEKAENHTFFDTPKNVILMIGDGMGFNHIDMALENGMEKFYARDLPNQGSAITRSQSVINGTAFYTDSAASGTALSSAYKTINGYIGMDPYGNPVKNVRELAQEYGAKTSILTTDVITGATPAAFLAHSMSRDNTDEISEQIENLIENGSVAYCEGDVGANLASETRNALYSVADSEAPFFTMIEGAYIDKVSHSNAYEDAVIRTERFNDSIAYAIEFVLCNPDTALIITADHECGGLEKSPLSPYKYLFTSVNHTNADVPVFAFGPNTEIFDSKAVENIDIARFIAAAFGAKTFGQTALVPKR